jgi:Zn-dependent peptidase ImmA (M78 family)
MKYKELVEFADNINIERTEIPLNALELSAILDIQIGNESAARNDFKGRDSPLLEYPAFLYIDDIGRRKIYYNSQTRFWNFYLMHEIAHWLLRHTEKTYANEIEADLLACILLVPPRLVAKSCKNSYMVCKMCNVPVDKADMYWQEIVDGMT